MDSQASIECGGRFRFANGPDRGTAGRSSGPGYRRTFGGLGVPRCAFVVLILIPLLSGGCMTSALWSSADPDEPVWVPASETTEERLNEKGLSYTKYRFAGEQLRDYGIPCDAEVVEGFLVEKTEFQKFSDTFWRIAATAFTLALDACGGVFIALLSDPDAMGGLVEGALTCAFH